MIRLTLLLLGAGPLRRAWWVFLAAAACFLLIGMIFIVDAFHRTIVVITDLLGVAFVVEGTIRLLRLAAIGFPNATAPVLKSLGFFAIGLLFIDLPWTHDLIATMALGAMLAIDGAFRMAAGIVIRSFRWRHAAVWGALEIVLALLIWTPWPVPYRHTVPFCIGIALVTGAWSLFQLGIQLRRLAPGSSITELPLFASANWHGRDVLHPWQAEVGSWDNEDPMLVHVWTPVASAVNAHRRLVVDRYIAAVDQAGVISTGHAALSLPPETYVSLCPADEMDHSPTDFGHLLRATEENNVAGVFKPSLAAECAAWKVPDRELAFRRYNAAALHAFLQSYRQTEIYNLTSRNCSSTVALSLDAALEGVLGRRRPWLALLLLLTDPAMWLVVLWRARAEAMTWTPGLVLDYATSLNFVLEGHRERWFARLWNTRRRYEERRRALLAEGRPTRSKIPAMASIVLSAMIFGMSYGLTAPLLALSLRQGGFGDSLIGANAAMHALGVLAMAPFLAGMAWRDGPKLPIAIAMLTTAAALALFPITSEVWVWFLLRFALGAAAETLFVMSETWLAQLSDEGRRASTMAIYTAALSLGFALGPMILTLVGTSGLLPFLAGAMIALLALLSIAMPWVHTPAFEQPSPFNPMRYLGLAPVAISATLLNAALETAGMSFLPLYAIREGWGQQSATMLLSVLLFGAVVLQLPIGWLADRIDRRKLVIGLAIASAAGALVWPFILNTAWLAYPLLFVWGGVFVGIYTIMMAVVGSRFGGGDMVAVYAVISIAWGAGALVGPGLAGTAMALTRYGLPIFAAVACSAFAALAIIRRNQKWQPVPPASAVRINGQPPS